MANSPSDSPVLLENTCNPCFPFPHWTPRLPACWQTSAGVAIGQINNTTSGRERNPLMAEKTNPIWQLVTGS
ncbi:hypothetical protein MATL_G00039040 [Megalops atlanticus]|uniref:Uncharacterized protein n=1 Tax=Megalops atlanticus TaxID=7932 RepID=A0A9D3QCU0_MEGAT|nr:hypothetical protein MATL_G00039040 [Megalops atlanticus]